MDFSTFCQEMYSLFSVRLPSQLLWEKDARDAVRRGGWHFPSIRSKGAYFFDLHQAYQKYLAGLSLPEIADYWETDFLQAEWNKQGRGLTKNLLNDRMPQWSLRICGGNEETIKAFSSPSSCVLYLHWDCHLLVACGRFLYSPSLHYEVLNEKDLIRLGLTEDSFWPFFWEQLALHNPPVLSAFTTEGSERPVRLSGEDPLLHNPAPGTIFSLTARPRENGGAVIFYPGILSRLQACWGPFFLALLSPHEALLALKRDEKGAERLRQLVEKHRYNTSFQEYPFIPSLYQYTVELGLVPC